MSASKKKRASGINKKDLTEKLAHRASIPKVRAAEYIDTLTDIISEALLDGKKVTISDFGTFNLSERAAFQGYDPRNDKRINVPRRIIPVFRAGKQLKNALNLPLIKSCTLIGLRQLKVEFTKVLENNPDLLLNKQNYEVVRAPGGKCSVTSIEISEEATASRMDKDKNPIEISGVKSIKISCSEHLTESSLNVRINASLCDVDGNSAEQPLDWPRR